MNRRDLTAWVGAHAPTRAVPVRGMKPFPDQPLPENPHTCPHCRGDDTDCLVCEGSGEVSPREHRAYNQDARADMDRD